eukprot:2726117-Heterocapsa_arctica.AAC.1
MGSRGLAAGRPLEASAAHPLLPPPGGVDLARPLPPTVPQRFRKELRHAGRAAAVADSEKHGKAVPRAALHGQRAVH